MVVYHRAILVGRQPDGVHLGGRAADIVETMRKVSSSGLEGRKPFDKLIEQGQLEPLQGAKLEVSQAK